MNKSKSKGFCPVYIYSKEDPKPLPSYSQVVQDKLIMELMKANDEKAATVLEEKGLHYL